MVKCAIPRYVDVDAAAAESKAEPGHVVFAGNWEPGGGSGECVCFALLCLSIGRVSSEATAFYYRRRVLVGMQTDRQTVEKFT